MKLIPASSAAWMIRVDSSWSVLPHAPNIIAPRHSGLTLTPVLPRLRFSMRRPYSGGRGALRRRGRLGEHPRDDRLRVVGPGHVQPQHVAVAVQVEAQERAAFGLGGDDRAQAGLGIGARGEGQALA